MAVSHWSINCQSTACLFFMSVSVCPFSILLNVFLPVNTGVFLLLEVFLTICLSVHPAVFLYWWFFIATAVCQVCVYMPLPLSVCPAVILSVLSCGCFSVLLPMVWVAV